MPETNTAPADPAQKITVKVALACRNSEGCPEIHTCTVDVSEHERQIGQHYDLAIENAEYNGYAGPFIPFDANDPAAKQLTSVASWFLTP